MNTSRMNISQTDKNTMADLEVLTDEVAIANGDPGALLTFWNERVTAYQADLAGAIVEARLWQAQVEDSDAPAPLITALLNQLKIQTYWADLAGAISQREKARSLVEDADAGSDEEPETVAVWAEGQEWSSEAALFEHLRATGPK